MHKWKRSHLSDALAGSPADLGVRVLDALQAHVDEGFDLLEHDLGAPLGDLREADEGGVAVSPVLLVVEEVLHHRRPLRRVEDGRPAQGDGHPVQALLPKLAQLALALVALLVFRGVPLLVVLHIH
eukprot:scaffold256756_cov36-Prasinocladus_malaysianus.AAC.2